MSVVLHYFTGTGNSFVQARALAESLKAAGEPGKVVLSPMTALFKGKMEDFSSFDAQGFVFPVYMWGIPLIVRDFAAACNFPQDCYLFAMTTCGGMAAATLPMLDDVLKRSGQSSGKRGLASGFTVDMPGNYTPFYGAWSEDKQQKVFVQAEARLHSIAAIIRERRNHPLERGWALANLFLTGIVYRFSSPKIPLMARKFKVDSNCTGCGVCQRVCPVSNIELKKTPQFRDHCQHCLACLHWCPEQAIQFGSSRGRKRYRHPEIKLQNMEDQHDGKVTEI
ncbi:MAG: hypothetical protein CVV64_17875 [Candidatus Wallbacteria bacterium HGW-Wallbacteria-1]|jgi:ferredoxin|uniref:4Fe-4S ferredoxin-type domain-containing protein n=1 Tax=Candidatus Wallbacteria bacterium HGW-Wallbacteria-1 TaxID=2013854 RepID=A0A2N1PJX8_9BACT|nr:MAG: hypothetical protein CVV64_17875 [Candidatus Wallbacteria bacterium HGW-Wallbacteria-1]